MKRASLLLSLLLLISAQGQGTVICGNRHLTPTVQRVLTDFRIRPEHDWLIVIVPEKLWTATVRVTEKQIGPMAAYSLLDEWTTYIRENALIGHSDKDIRHELAHELGHLTLHTADERKAENFARGEY